MKKLYFSTFVHGLEKPVEAMLRKEGGVAVERIVPGAALYRSVREPSMPFVHQTFSVLFQMKPVSDVNDAIKRLMATGSWLDRLVARTNFTDNESRMYFDRKLRENGVYERLEEMGIEDGEFINIQGMEFEYRS